MVTMNVITDALMKHVIGMGVIVMMIFVLNNVWHIGLVITIVTSRALIMSAASIDEIVRLLKIVKMVV